MQPDDTIVAISSAVGASARMIVRLSGPDADAITAKLITGALPNPRSASIRRLRFRAYEFPATIYRFIQPNSATTQDTIEFHLPGNPLLSRMLVDELIQSGARQAEPGEFTARAFFNGRLNLSEAEGVGAMVGAQNDAELSAARRLMSGELSKRIAPIVEQIASILALIEAEIDFSDEPVSFLPRAKANQQISDAIAALRDLLDQSARFDAIVHEPRIVLAGRPNAGKSTLLNRLAGDDRAIVSHIAGTTRDALGATIRLRRGFARIIDVAGLDASTSEMSDRMNETANAAIAGAEVVVLVRAIDDEQPPLDVEPSIVVRSKSDLMERSRDTLAISAKTGDGIEAFLLALDQLCFGRDSGTSAALALRLRHVRAIEEALQSLTSAAKESNESPELLALALREALDALGAINGNITPDDVLGKIFASFCIGK